MPRDRCRLAPATPVIESAFAGTAEAVRDVLAETRRRLAADLSRHSCDTVELVLAEALNNVVEHAYAGDGGTVILRIWPQPPELVIEIVDRGRPMPGGTAPAGLHPAAAGAGELPEGGFGWFLIRELVREVCYHRDAGENRLRLTLALRRGSAAGTAPPA